MTYDSEHRDDVDVYAEREGTGLGTILGVILAIVVVLAIVWFFFLGGLGQNANAPADQNQDTPAEIQPPAEELPNEPLP